MANMFRGRLRLLRSGFFEILKRPFSTDARFVFGRILILLLLLIIPLSQPPELLGHSVNQWIWIGLAFFSGWGMGTMAWEAYGTLNGLGSDVLWKKEMMKENFPDEV